MISGLAAFAGPIIGSLLYYIGGYRLPLFTLGTIYMLMVVIMWPIAQKSNSDDSYEEAIEEAEKTDEAKEYKVRLGVKEILGPKRALFGFMSQIIS